MARHFFVLWLAGLHYCIPLAAQHLPFQEIRHIFPDTLEERLEAKKMIATRDHGFLVTGSAGPFGFIAKLNACGDPVWFQPQAAGSETVLNDIIEMPSGDLLAVGACRACAPHDSTRKALVLLTSPEGLALRDTFLGRAGFDAYATAVIRTASGKTAVAGSLIWAAFLSPTNAFLAILDDQLRPEVWREYNALYYDQAQSLVQTSDGGFVLGGYASASLFAPRQAQLFRTDSQGQLIWQSLSSATRSQYNAVLEAADGKIVALGRAIQDSLDRQDLYLAVHGPDGGQPVQEKYFGSPAEDEGRSLFAVQDGYLVAGVWGEPRRPNWNTSDWIFQLDHHLDLVEEDFFDSYLFAHSLTALAPLSADGKDFAYLSTLNFFDARSILFHKRNRRGVQSVLSEAPQHYQLTPRDLSTNMGSVTYRGEIALPDAYEQLQLDVFRDGQLFKSLSDATPGTFSFQVDIPAELAGYTFRLKGLKAGLELVEAEACDVVAGDAYFIQGQSNALAGIPFFAGDTTAHAYRYHRNPFVRNFGLKYEEGDQYVWRKEAGDDTPFADNYSGQWGLVMGEKIVQEQGVPVAIINGGIGGISIDQMMPDPSDPHGASNAYGRFFRRVERSGLKDHFRAYFFFQGETNALPGYQETVASYKDKFQQLRQAWLQDYVFDREYLFQIRPGCWEGNFPAIQEAQRQLALELPEMEVMSSTGMNHDGCHYYYTNGYQRAGRDIYRLLARDLYVRPTESNITAPAVDSIWFSSCDRTELSLRLHTSADEFYWTPGWETDFRLEAGGAASVSAGSITGNTLVLSLSEAPAATLTGLSYIAHAGGDQAPVKNANGIGMLAFFNIPVVGPQTDLATGIEQQDRMLTVAETEADYQWINCADGQAIPGATGRSFTAEEAGSYAVVLSRGACRDTSACVPVMLVDANEAVVGASSAKLYPNPASGEVHLDLPWDAEVKIYDALSRLQDQRLLSAGERSLPLHLPPGLYRIVLRHAAGMQVLPLRRE